MSKYQSAAIPYRRDATNELEILLVTSRRRGRWVLPKGKVKRGLLPHTSAERGAFEEAGVLGEIARLPVATYRQLKVSNDGASSEIAVCAFALRVDNELRSWPEMALRQRRWIKIVDIADTVRDPALRTALRTFEAAQAAVEAA